MHADLNWDVVKGKWKQLRGKAKEEWGDITDDDWDEIDGQKDKLVGKLQERYGYEREEAERRAHDRVSAWDREH